jgi:hypothetical protein
MNRHLWAVNKEGTISNVISGELLNYQRRKDRKHTAMNNAFTTTVSY